MGPFQATIINWLQIHLLCPHCLLLLLSQIKTMLIYEKEISRYKSMTVNLALKWKRVTACLSQCNFLLRFLHNTIANYLPIDSQLFLRIKNIHIQCFVYFTSAWICLIVLRWCTKFIPYNKTYIKIFSWPSWFATGYGTFMWALLVCLIIHSEKSFRKKKSSRTHECMKNPFKYMLMTLWKTECWHWNNVLQYESVPETLKLVIQGDHSVFLCWLWPVQGHMRAKGLTALTTAAL